MIKQLFKRKDKEKEIVQPLAVGTHAPDFSLPATSGGSITLSELRGRPVVLVFYPADASSVCSSQLALYNEALHLFEEYEAQIIGISIDGLPSHLAFAESLKLDYPLLADDDPYGAVSRAYGTYNEGDGISERVLYVLDADGIVRWRYLSPRKVNPGANGILDALESLVDPAPIT